MNKLSVTLLAIIVGLLVYILLFAGKPNEDDKYAREKQRIDSLSKAILILEKEQKTQDSLIVLYRDSLVVVNKQIDSTKHKITEIRNYYGNKIKNLTNATHDELSNFFTERYK